MRIIIVLALLLSSQAYAATKNEMDNQGTRTTDESLGHRTEENRENIERYHRENTRPACPVVVGVVGAVGSAVMGGGVHAGVVGVVGSKIGERFCDH